MISFESLNYRTTQEDLHLIVQAVQSHQESLSPDRMIPADPSLRIQNRLFIVLDATQKILLLPPGLPKLAYTDSTQIAGLAAWRMVTTPLSTQDKQDWLEKEKLGSYSAWDDGLNELEPASEWRNVVIALKNELVWNPTHEPSDPKRSKTLPVAIFTAPKLRYQIRYPQSLAIDIDYLNDELKRAIPHEAGSHINIMAKVQSWPDGHGDDQSLKGGKEVFYSLLENTGLKIPEHIEVLLQQYSQNIMPIGFVHELLAYLTEIVETGLSIDQAYIDSASYFLKPRNVFGCVMAAHIVQSIGMEKAASFGNALIQHMIRN